MKHAQQAGGKPIASGSDGPACAAERQQPNAALQEQNIRLKLLADTAAQLLAADDPEDVVARLFHHVAEHLGLDACFSFAVNDEGDVLQLDSHLGVPEQAARAMSRLKFGDAVCGTVAQTRRPIHAADVQSSSDPLTHRIRQLGIRAYACNPLIAGGRLLGALSFGTRRRDRFSEEDLEFFRTVSHYVAVVKERRRAEGALRAREEQLRLITDALPGVVARLDARERYRFVNATYEEWVGMKREAVIGRSLRDVIGASSYAVAEPYYERVFNGERVTFENVIRRPGCPRRDMLVTLVPDRDEAGMVRGCYALGTDITERKRAEEHQKLLIAELSHRVKNTLATVDALAVRTLRTSGTPEAFRATLLGRLRALAGTHSLLTRSNWHGAALRDLVQEELAPYRQAAGDGVAVLGPDITLTPRAALSFGMVLHELTTNAVKHGALSQPGGRVEIGWNVEDRDAAAMLVLTWTERDGPPVRKPSHAGFGSSLIERTTAYELDGAARLAFHEEGVSCVIELPLTADVGALQPAPGAPSH